MSDARPRDYLDRAGQNHVEDRHGDIMCCMRCAEEAIALVANEARLWAQRVSTLAARLDATREALAESVKLQSHYAELLNMHDGGQRIGFKDADEWMARLAALEKRRAQEPER